MKRAWILVLIFSLFGCGSQPLQENILDTPELYVSNGYKLIHKEIYDDAEREFGKALKLDPKNSGAYAGLALVRGCRGDREGALPNMKKAASLARSVEEEYRVYVGWIRLHTALKEEGWLKESEKAFFWASSLRKDQPDAYYYMGLAYKDGYKVGEARAAFLRVLEIRKALVLHAEQELRILKKIESARPRSDFGRKVVVFDHVNRAETAALFYYELGVVDLMKKGSSPAEKSSPAPKAAASDIQNHPLRGVLTAILELRIKGLSVYKDGTFDPNEVVTRAAFSVMMADIIERTAKGPLNPGKPPSKGSPYRDVKEDAPYLDAIQVCAAGGGGLEAENEMFNPMGALTGYDAVYSIQKFRSRLNPP